jgi:hypothetical protein
VLSALAVMTAMVQGRRSGTAQMCFRSISVSRPSGDGTDSLLSAKSGRSRQLWSSCIAEQSLQSHAARDGCEAIEFAEAT